jgi:hypothetical protein
MDACAAAELAPQIQLPPRVEADLRVPGVVRAQAVVDDRAVDLLLLRPQVRHGDAQHGPRLEYPQARDLERQVLPVGVLDEPVENRVLEDGPPLAQVRLDVRRLGGLCLQPVLRHGHVRPDVVRPHHAPGAAERGQHQPDRPEPRQRSAPAESARSRLAVC